MGHSRLFLFHRQCFPSFSMLFLVILHHFVPCHYCKKIIVLELFRHHTLHLRTHGHTKKSNRYHSISFFSSLIIFPFAIPFFVYFQMKLFQWFWVFFHIWKQHHCHFIVICLHVAQWSLFICQLCLSFEILYSKHFIGFDDS